MTISEKDLREQIRSLCKIYGWRMAFTQFSMMSPKGFPDLVLIRPPRLVFAELKSEIGKTTPEQDDWLGELDAVAERMRAAYEDTGGIAHGRADVLAIRLWRPIEVYTWRPHDIEHIARILARSAAPSAQGRVDGAAVSAGRAPFASEVRNREDEPLDTMTNGLEIKRGGDLHPQGREDVKTFEYREGQPIGVLYGKAIEQLFTWAFEKDVDVQDLITQTPQLRRIVELSGGKVTSVR